MKEEHIQLFKKAALPLGIVVFGLLIAGISALVRFHIYNQESSGNDSLAYDIQSDDPLLRARAARRPDFFVSSGNIETFFKLTYDSDLYAKHTAIDAAVNNVEIFPEKYLVDKLQLGSENEKDTAAVLLLFKNNPAGLSRILNKLPVDNEYLMEKLIKQLTNFSQPEIKETLIKIAQDSNNTALQVYAIWALGKLDDKEIRIILESIRNNSKENVIQLATRYALEVQISN